MFLTNSLTKDGITWNFCTSVSAGRYITNDFYVVGPVLVSSITPATTTRSDGTVKNCTILGNSLTSSIQSIDGALSYFIPYSVSGNLASGINAVLPLVLTPGQRLISFESRDALPPITRAAVLTCVSSYIPDDIQFRPGYTDGSIDSIDSTKFHLNYINKLANIDIASVLSPSKTTPTQAGVSSTVSGFWFDPFTGLLAQEFRNVSSSPYKDYDYAAILGNAALSLNCALSFDKSGIARHLVQKGIDNYSNLVNLNNYYAGPGALGSGKKFTILFAGIMLEDRDMMEVGLDYPIVLSGQNRFTEDNSTFVVSSISGTINYGYGGYATSDVGIPEWGTTHWSNPSLDDSTWLNTSAYGTDDRRYFTMKNWVGYLFAAKIMGMQKLWNHDPLWAYFNRYFAKEVEIEVAGSRESGRETLAPNGMDWQYDYVSGFNSEYFPSDSASQLSAVKYYGISTRSNILLYVSSNPVSGQMNYSINVLNPLTPLSSIVFTASAFDYVYTLSSASSLEYIPRIFQEGSYAVSSTVPTIETVNTVFPMNGKILQVGWVDTNGELRGTSNAIQIT